MRVAIVHDYLSQYGGAERVLDELKQIWPEAPVFVALYDPERMPTRYRDWTINTSWIDRLPFARRNHQAMLPLYPSAFESFDLTGFDLVVSSSSGFAHGVITGPQTLNICYSHSPPRFLWSYHDYAAREHLGTLRRLATEAWLSKLRLWDRVAADRTQHWISTSRTVQQRLMCYYRKPSTIIPPPVDTTRFDVASGAGKHYLLLMRLVGWKRPDVVVEACSALNLPLVVAGDGRETPRLKKMAGPSVEFVGRVNDEQMRSLYRDAIAFILPAEEDFGITPLEAMASGRPVIAYGRGGVLDTVIPGVTGEFFDEQSAASLMQVLSTFTPESFDPAVIREHAEQFDSRRFRQRIETFVKDRVAEAEDRLHFTAPRPPLAFPAPLEMGR